VLALAAYRRRVDFYDILHDQRSNPGIRSLSERIEVIPDEETNRSYPDLYRSILTVELKNGVRLIRDVTHPRGSPENAISDDELRQKFNALTADVMSPEQSLRIGDAIEHLEQMDDINELTNLLAL
jgi:2-methylcitrate dehydratase PrpD